MPPEQGRPGRGCSVHAWKAQGEVQALPAHKLHWHCNRFAAAGSTVSRVSIAVLWRLQSSKASLHDHFWKTALTPEAAHVRLPATLRNCVRLHCAVL